jgi:iron complex transport system substrate-binding protein
MGALACAHFAIVALALLACLPAQAAGIVSLNLCTDEFLVLLAPERIAALSPLARDPALSVVAEAARQFPMVRADAEAVLALHPDFVLAGPFGAQTTLAALERRGVRVERTRLPPDFPAIREETRRLAQLLDVPSRGAALLVEMDSRLAALPARPVQRALPLLARGFVAGPGSLEDSVLRAAGFINASTGLAMGLETIAAHPPALLVVAQAPEYPSLATDLLQHPVLAGIPRRVLPPSLLACGGPWTVRAVELLAR